VCRRRRELALRKLRLREAWLALWLEQGRENRTSARELAEEIAALLDDIATLRAALEGAAGRAEDDLGKIDLSKRTAGMLKTPRRP
jgi:hypothetical protein